MTINELRALLAQLPGDMVVTLWAFDMETNTGVHRELATVHDERANNGVNECCLSSELD